MTFILALIVGISKVLFLTLRYVLKNKALLIVAVIVVGIFVVKGAISSQTAPPPGAGAPGISAISPCRRGCSPGTRHRQQGLLLCYLPGQRAGHYVDGLLYL